MNQEIKEKAEYCLGCKTKPCRKGCPLENDITEFIKSIKEEDYEKAFEVLSETTVLESICGRVCPQKTQCEGNCVRGIKGKPVSIGELEKFIGDMAIKENYQIIEKEKIKKNGKKVAVVGGGPAGLTCSAFLAKMGYSVTIYEKYNYLGGILKHGIPEFRLPKDILENTINRIIDLGIDVKFNQELGKNINIEELSNEYDAVFLAIGANVSTKMNIPGEDLKRCIWGK